ncbi:metal/formaldehyde-sensitive transcriptional repressor (plasmid) [Paracoccus liaowanqingii]|uniref:Metal/formaldehyde-sensitive transcriptional repressor n=1 Tax=Paracoccus liaowanqingii TaxID=2560053 RepID=A0A4Y5STJ1_9RHOB|nr:metal/formaldehyde-sensitive transcriptional repressor [Paracoccus liaowanqingii]QDA36841.1 metal/formaldehyde-sensitive transcriptional repressor [Paracoccus liaowanqingii]
MGHTIKNKAALLARVRRLKGQIDAIERMLDEDAPCAEVVNLVASVRGAISGLTAELIEDHVRNHVADPETDTDPNRAKAAGELIAVIRTYLK